MINLLPPSYRKRRAHEQQFRLVLVFAVAVGIGLIFLSIFLLVIEASLAVEKEFQESRLSSLQEETSKEDSALGEVNAWNMQLENVSSFKKERRVLKEVFDVLKQSLPPNLYLLTFSFTTSFETQKKGEEIQKNPAVIAVTGYAPLRHELLIFKDALQAHPFFQEVVFPPSNWVSPSDITFSFQAKLKENP